VHCVLHCLGKKFDKHTVSWYLTGKWCAEAAAGSGKGAFIRHQEQHSGCAFLWESLTVQWKLHKTPSAHTPARQHSTRGNDSSVMLGVNHLHGACATSSYTAPDRQVAPTLCVKNCHSLPIGSTHTCMPLPPAPADRTHLQHWHVHSCCHEVACVLGQWCTTTDEQAHATSHSSLQASDITQDLVMTPASTYVYSQPYCVSDSGAAMGGLVCLPALIVHAACQ
jgi:hypothetical protein